MTEVLRYLGQNPILALIIGCEVGFWVLLLAGLVARYPLRLPRLGAVLLCCTPLVDVVLLVATVFDLRAGGEAKFAHGVAAIYLGVSLAFGHSMLRWADQRFAHRFAGGPPPVKPPRYGHARVRHEWREWRKFVVAWAVACSVMLLLVFVVSTPARTALLWAVAIPSVTGFGLVWLVCWPLQMTLFPPRDPACRTA